MDIDEAYRIMQKASGIKVGDKVKCLRHFEGDEMGSDVCASRDINSKRDFVNNRAIGKVERIFSNHIWVNCGGKYNFGWAFPFFSLKVVEPAKEEKMITVAGKEYSESALAKAMQEYVG